MAKRSGVCTILNDDPKPVIAAGNVSVTEGDSGRKSVNLALTANQPISGWVDVRSVDGTAIAGRDYDAFSSSTFWNGETQRQVALQIIGNTAVEPDKQFTVHVSTPANGGITVVNPDATVTILNDDQGLGPATQNVPKGSTAAVLLDAGTAPPSPQTIAVAVSDPCIQAPPSVTLSARSVAIPVAALTGPCSANVTVTLPAALGGKKYSAGIRTYNPVTVTFDPPSPQLYLGQTLNVHVDVSPLDAPIVLPLVAVGDTVEVPASVSVDAHGGSFTVKGMRQGPLTVVATLPPQNGNLTASLAGSVAAAPATVTIFQLAPPSGPAAGGTAVTLTGVNFRADCTFGFGGVPATNVAVHDATSTTVTAPAHVAGSVDVTASCGAESYTLRNGFTYVAGSASISSVAPSSGAVDGGTLVRITGSDFVPSCWAFFGGTAAHNVSVIGTTEVIASTPAHAAGAVAVSLRCGPGNEPALGGAFNYSAAGEPAPVITSVSPLAAAPGQAVTIDGSRFRLSDTVTFGSVAAQVVGSAPDGHVVLVPTMPAGNVSVNVDDGNGHLSTTGPIFSVLQPLLLHVLQVTPMTVPAGGEIELVWSGFRDPYTFALGTAPLRLRKHSTTSGVAAVPATLAPGRYMLRVADGTGATFDAALVLTVTDSGTVVAGVAPVCATTGAGTAISITGRGFAAGAIVTINGVPAANVAVIDATHINATLPALAPGLATVAVDGATLTNALRIYSPFDPDGCGTAPRPRPARR